MTQELTSRQRWAINFSVLLTALAFLGGLLLRTNVESATALFSDKVTGITARYPANWLLTRGGNTDTFIFRVEDPAALPFKTSLSVSIMPVGPNATVYDVANLLTLNRAQSLSSYTSLGITPITLPNGAAATQVDYAYAASESNPFLQSLPIVVSASDVIVLSKGEAIIANFQSDAQTFAQNKAYFDAFLRRLEY